MTIQGAFVEKVVNAVMDDKRFAMLFVVLGVILWYSWAWADGKHANLVKQSDFNTFTVRFEIVSASQLIRDLDMKIDIAEATNASESRLEILNEELSNAKKYKDCLLAERNNCSHILKDS